MIQLFQEMYSRVIVEENLRLSDMEKIVFYKPKSQNKIIFDVDDGFPDTYYEIVSDDEFNYSVDFCERGSCYTKYKGSNANIAVAALFILLIRFIPKSQAAANTEKAITYEIQQGKIESARQLIVKTVGNEVVSFDKSEYNKISLVNINNNKFDIWYHNHSILFCSDFNKPDLESAYLIVYRICHALLRFYRVVAEISDIIGEIPQQEKEKIVYVFLTGLAY